MKASDLLVAALENEGVDAIFALPGEENLAVMESLRTSNIVVHLVRHEQSAAFMAAAHGRLTGKPGVCLTTLGPGATNAMTGIAYAHLGGMPCILITGQKPIKYREQGSFQILDVVEMMTPITKHSSQVIDASHISSTIHQAFRTAVTDKPGPVHIEIPEDIAEDQTDGVCYPVTEFPKPVAQANTVKRIAERVRLAKRPLLLISSGAARSDAGSTLQKLIEHQGLYFCTTQMGKGVVDERHPKCLGTAAISSGDYLHEAINQADLILNVGHDLTEKPPYIMEADSCDVIHIDTTPARVDKVYFAKYEMIGCIATNVDLLVSQLVETNERGDYFDDIQKTIMAKIFDIKPPVTMPLSPQYLVHELTHDLDQNIIFSLDNGLYKIWFARNFIAQHKHHLLLDNALATMGAGLPVAIATKLSQEDKTVVAVCGDGGFMMNCQELETAVRLDLDLIILVLTDNAYGMIKWKQDNDGYPAYGMDFNAVDLVQYANAFGAHGHKLNHANEIIPLINKAVEQGGVHLIDVPIDYNIVVDEKIG